MKPTTMVLAVCLAVPFSGCGTVMTKGTGQWGKSYSGAACSGRVTLAAATAGWETWPLVPLALADTAVSFVADTLLLPVDLPLKAPTSEHDVCPISMPR